MASDIRTKGVRLKGDMCEDDSWRGRTPPVYLSAATGIATQHPVCMSLFASSMLTWTVIRLLFSLFSFPHLSLLVTPLLHNGKNRCSIHFMSQSQPGSNSSTSFDPISSDISLFFRPPLLSFFPHSTQVYSTNLTSSLIFSVIPAGRRTGCFRKKNSQFKRLNYPSLVFRHSSSKRDRLSMSVCRNMGMQSGLTGWQER